MTQNETKFMDSALALAETLHFTKAAKRLRISQPQLTKNIQELEDLLGFRIFDRDRKTVALNDAGRAYVGKAKLSIMYAERAFQEARDLMRDADTVLHVGRSPYTDPFLVSTLQSIQLPLYSKLKLELHSQFSYELVDEVLDGSLDLAIVTQPPESPLLTTVKIAESPFYIAMSKKDKLASSQFVTLEALSNHCWVLFERRLHPQLYDDVLRHADQQGAVPRKIRHITAPEEAFPLLADGECVAFVVKAGALLLSRNGVTVRPLAAPELNLKTYLASFADNDSKLLGEFVRAYMRKIAPPKKEVQLSLPIAARLSA
ncbi:MAG: LysR family transcriptional regulator [Acidobacteria bacterium]|nr:LysR family transcriptional regulator [Acidobacteriota bacterium]